MKIEIIKFERKSNIIEIGFRQGIAAVYANASAVLTDVQAKQRAYEQVWKTLEYEQTLDKPSFAVLDNVDEEGNVIPFEIFNPAEPKVTKIEIIGDKIVHFTDAETAEQSRVYQVVAYDQYGGIYNEQIIERTFTHNDYIDVISVTIDDVTETLEVQVNAYTEPQPGDLELLQQRLNATEIALIELMMEG